MRKRYRRTKDLFTEALRIFRGKSRCSHWYFNTSRKKICNYWGWALEKKTTRRLIHKAFYYIYPRFCVKVTVTFSVVVVALKGKQVTWKINWSWHPGQLNRNKTEIRLKTLQSANNLRVPCRVNKPAKYDNNFRINIFPLLYY